MATKSTNATIFTVAIVAIGGYAAYRYFGTPKRQAQTGGIGVGSGSGYEEDQPYGGTQSSDNSLASLLSQLLGGSKSGASAPNAAAGLAGGAGGSGSSGGILSTFADTLAANDVQAADAPNPEFGGDSLDTYDANTNDTSLYQLPYQDSNQQFDTPGLDINGAGGGGNDGIGVDQAITYQSQTLNDTIPDDTGISMDFGGDAGP